MRLLIQSRGLHIWPALFFSLLSIFFRSFLLSLSSLHDRESKQGMDEERVVCVCVFSMWCIDPYFVLVVILNGLASSKKKNLGW